MRSLADIPLRIATANIQSGKVAGELIASNGLRWKAFFPTAATCRANAPLASQPSAGAVYLQRFWVENLRFQSEDFSS